MLTEGVTLSGKNTVYGRRSGEAHLLSAEGVNALRQKDRDHRDKWDKLCLSSFVRFFRGELRFSPFFVFPKKFTEKTHGIASFWIYG